MLTRDLRSVSFLIGVTIAVIVGVLSVIIQPDTPIAEKSPVLFTLLIFLGIIIGISNVTKRETRDFLLASVAVVIITSFGGSSLGNVSFVGVYIQSILTAILTLMVPAAIIVAIKELYILARY